MAEKYLPVLCALSSDAACAEARSVLLDKMSKDAVCEIVQRYLDGSASKETVTQAASLFLAAEARRSSGPCRAGEQRLEKRTAMSDRLTTSVSLGLSASRSVGHQSKKRKIVRDEDDEDKIAQEVVKSASWVAGLSLCPIVDREDDGDGSDVDRSSIKAKTKSEKAVPELPLVFWDARSETWRVESILGRNATTAIWAKFTKDYLPEANRKKSYARFAKGAGEIADRCVN
ncbi:hypothetical protein BU25DRAFT_453630 [Macroventuria anomochaeta]|uniref:Uncharacterized protein n=1 Tax=Macroventuria anomochaeta TaxID=301207 RepID=A0ACB6SI07_9PLEO|nr:uncharacterized protein BU25DRAFT_453630 [Macroventuria anomochaeta]KAF2633920.1 hypothetical protein BU25DRAFT_453630 [Macroventuria anomochaeta]